MAYVPLLLATWFLVLQLHSEFYLGVSNRVAFFLHVIATRTFFIYIPPLEKSEVFCSPALSSGEQEEP